MTRRMRPSCPEPAEGSRSTRTTVELSRMQLPDARTAPAMFSKSTLMPLRGYMYFVKYVAGSALMPRVLRMMFFRFSFATRCACFDEICDVGRPHTLAE